MKSEMDAMAVSPHRVLVWDDFLWLDQSAPVPPDTVIEGQVAAVLTAPHKGYLISDNYGL